MMPHIHTAARRRGPALLAERLAWAAAAAIAAACRDANTATPPSTPAAHPPGYVIDSAVPIDEALRRFRAGLPAVTALDGAAAPSRDALVRTFAAAVAARDTARLRGLALSRAEFAFLYYPSTQYTHPPYELAPETLWFLSRQASDKGLRRVVDRLGGHGFRAADLECEAEPARQGANRLHQQCTVAFAGRGQAEKRGRLFGSIVERDGRFKFVTYGNDF